MSPAKSQELVANGEGTRGSGGGHDGGGGRNSRGLCSCSNTSHAASPMAVNVFMMCGQCVAEVCLHPVYANDCCALFTLACIHPASELTTVRLAPCILQLNAMPLPGYLSPEIPARA
ncbi:hypothetical protein B0H13DRAFT_2300637 [Mycena leptocephala]|nr:hypothetical protein B0H13DRAFT_2300637 [Mycena leptocephala]